HHVVDPHDRRAALPFPRRLDQHLDPVAPLEPVSPDQALRKVGILRVQAVIDLLVDDERAAVGDVDVASVRERAPVLGRRAEYLQDQLEPVRGALERNLKLTRECRQVGQVERIEMVQVKGLPLARGDLLGERVERRQVREPRRIRQVAVHRRQGGRRGLRGGMGGGSSGPRLPMPAVPAAFALVALPRIAVLPVAVPSALPAVPAARVGSGFARIRAVRGRARLLLRCGRGRRRGGFGRWLGNEDRCGRRFRLPVRLAHPRPSALGRLCASVVAGRRNLVVCLGGERHQVYLRGAPALALSRESTMRSTWALRKTVEPSFQRTKSDSSIFRASGNCLDMRCTASARSIPRCSKRASCESGSHATQTVKSNQFSSDFSNRSGTSTRKSASGPARSVARTISKNRGCVSSSSHCLSASSEKTIRASAGRSTSPEGPKMASPKCALNAAFTLSDGSTRSRTMISESTCRYPRSTNSFAAVDLPQPKPPVSPRTITLSGHRIRKTPGVQLPHGRAPG